MAAAVTTRDRNDNYVPDGLYLDGTPQFTEISPRRGDRELPGILVEQARELIASIVEWDAPLRAAAMRWIDLADHHAALVASPKTARIAHGQADELNRDHGTWWWVDVSGDGTHWSQFRGHRIQIDVTFSTSNEREVNEWKGRDEIRPSGQWHLALNRQPICDGYIRGDDPLATLRRIEDTARRLMDHDAINWFDPKPVAEQLAGRRVYYERTPAVVSYVSTLNQGCVGLKPAGVDLFPPSVHALDDDDAGDPYERDEVKVELLSPHVWWWRRKLVAGETEGASA